MAEQENKKPLANEVNENPKAEKKSMKNASTQVKSGTKRIDEVKKPSFLQRTVSFFKDSWKELMKVVWPSKADTIKSTAVLLVLVAIVALYLGLVDGILNQIFKVLV